MSTDPNLRTQVDRAAGTIDVRQSALSAFLDCKRRYFWEYGQGIEPDYPVGVGRPWTNADVGSAFHLGIEWAQTGTGDPLLAPEAYAAENELTENARGKPFDAELVRIMIAGHLEDRIDNGLDIGEHILEVERQGAATVHDVNHWDVTVHYKVDRVIELTEEGLLVIDDLKSVDRFMPIDNYLPQLIRYAMLYRQETGVRADRVRTTQVRRVKRTGEGPFYDRPWVTVTEEMYRESAIELRAQLTDLVRSIESDGPWYPHRTGECGWKCRVEDICKAQVRGDDVETLVQLHYREKGSA